MLCTFHAFSSFSSFSSCNVTCPCLSKTEHVSVMLMLDYTVLGVLSVITSSLECIVLPQ